MGSFIKDSIGAKCLVTNKFHANGGTPISIRTTPTGSDSQKINGIIAILEAYGLCE